MASNVFGTPITHITLKEMEEFKDQRGITRRDLAVIAFETKNAGGKDARARQFVEDLRKQYALDGFLCLIYNATGDALRLDTYCDESLFIAPSPYPMVIGNGQWGAYLKRAGGAVVYAARDATGNEFQVMYAYSKPDPGRCYTEIRPAKYYKPKDVWATFKAPLDANKTYTYQAHESGFSTFASIGGTTLSPFFEGIVTLEGAWTRFAPARGSHPWGNTVVGMSALITHEDNEDNNLIENENVEMVAAGGAETEHLDGSHQHSA